MRDRVQDRRTGGTVLFALLLLVAACGEPPNRAPLERARALFELAESMDAATYAPQEFAAAKAAFDEAEAEFAAQEKSLFGRSPERGQELANRAATLAQQAIDATETASHEARTGTRDALAKAETAMLDAEGALATLARCAREKRVSDLRSYGDRLKELQQAMADANGRFDEGEYGPAREGYEALIRTAATLTLDARQAAFGAGC